MLLERILSNNVINNFSKGALYNIVLIIDKLNLLFEEYNTQIQRLDLYKLYHKVYISHLFDDKIKLAIEDLKHVQEREIPLEVPKNLNEVDIEYFKNELDKIRNEKLQFEKKNTHLLTDYCSLLKVLSVKPKVGLPPIFYRND
ncbi:hypothetical protein [Myroides phaeus]|uniref:Uncharacterized protein n=1 Tax=Myroides phaeus TaxID=702745 RepID=A0A1G8FIW0_9FLAO|nr:hypothetical protein [Myroides phaeus]SDH82055.1 hypothetical protein SAMN05421818_11713 [Myroides phaeus]